MLTEKKVRKQARKWISTMQSIPLVGRVTGAAAGEGEHRE